MAHRPRQPQHSRPHRHGTTPHSPLRYNRSLPDIFYIDANNFTLHPPPVHPNASAIHRIDLSQPSPTPTLVAALPVSGLLNGLTTLSSQYILIADAGLGLIWRLDLETHETTALIADPLMRVLDPLKEPIGVNGVKVHGAYLYFSNTNQELLGRIPISLVTGEARGEAEVVVRYGKPDDFVFVGHGGGGSILFAGNDTLREVREGVMSVVAESPLLAGSTAVAVGVGGCEGARKVYVGTNGGVEQYAAGNVTVPGRVLEVRWG